MGFQREERYTVLKHTDIHEALDPDETTTLIELEEKISIYREAQNKIPLQCVVVESDWPEYEIVWKMIEQAGNLDDGMPPGYGCCCV